MLSFCHKSTFLALCLIVTAPGWAVDSPDYRAIVGYITRHCSECHNTGNQDSRIDLESLVWNFDAPIVFNQWETVFDKVASAQMPPAPNDMPESDRRVFMNRLAGTCRRTLLHIALCICSWLLAVYFLRFAR